MYVMFTFKTMPNGIEIADLNFYVVISNKWARQLWANYSLRYNQLGFKISNNIIAMDAFKLYHNKQMLTSCEVGCIFQTLK